MLSMVFEFYLWKESGEVVFRLSSAEFNVVLLSKWFEGKNKHNVSQIQRIHLLSPKLLERKTYESPSTLEFCIENISTQFYVNLM